MTSSVAAHPPKVRPTLPEGEGTQIYFASHTPTQDHSREGEGIPRPSPGLSPVSWGRSASPDAHPVGSGSCGGTVGPYGRPTHLLAQTTPPHPARMLTPCPELKPQGPQLTMVPRATAPSRGLPGKPLSLPHPTPVSEGWTRDSKEVHVRRQPKSLTCPWAPEPSLSCGTSQSRCRVLLGRARGVGTIGWQVTGAAARFRYDPGGGCGAQHRAPWQGTRWRLGPLGEGESRKLSGWMPQGTSSLSCLCEPGMLPEYCSN